MSQVKTCKCIRCGSADAIPTDYKRHGKSIGPFCTECWQSVSVCTECGDVDIISKDARKKVGITSIGNYVTLCTPCRAKMQKKNDATCPCCLSVSKYVYTTSEGSKYCPRCLHPGAYTCECCDTKYGDSSTNAWNNPVTRKTYHDFYTQHLGGVCITCLDSKVRGNKRVKKVVPKDCQFCNGSRTTINYLIDPETKKHKSICDECLSHITTCTDCNALTNHDFNMKVYGASSSQSYCRSCYEKYKRCYYCGYFHKNTTNSSKSGRTIAVCDPCKSKLVQCSYCKGTETKAKLKAISSGYPDNRQKHLLCRGCRDRTRVCDSCRALSEHVWDGQCRSCIAKRTGSAPWQEWNFKPVFKYHGGDLTKDTFFGIENEVQFPNKVNLNRRIADVYKAYKEDEAYVVRDGSINYGFEIVTHPRTYSDIKSKDWSKLFPKGIIPHSSVGMHIHVSKIGLSRRELYKFVSFINSKPNFIRIIGQRISSGYASKIDEDLKKVVALKQRRRVKYCKANVTEHTVELRFFASALNQTTLFKNLEFAQALHEFVKVFKLRQCTVPNFIGYVKDNRADYSNLEEFLSKYQLTELVTS